MALKNMIDSYTGGTGQLFSTSPKSRTKGNGVELQNEVFCPLNKSPRCHSLIFHSLSKLLTFSAKCSLLGISFSIPLTPK